MTKLSKYCLALIIIFAARSSIHPQNVLQNQFNYAKKLFDKEQYYDSITEFKRLLFFDNDRQYGYAANNYIAKAYKAGAKFSDAIIFFTYSGMSAGNAAEMFNAEINIVRINILRRTTDRALQLLDFLAADKRFANKGKEISYWKGWAYIFADEWGKAANSFAESEGSRELYLLCTKVENEKYSVGFAQIISHFIPGAGQIYTGHYLSGLLSLGWNVLWGYLSVTAFIQNRVFDGLAITNFLWLRFYNGNLQNAEKFAVEKNLKISNRALNFLQNEFHGQKP